jgi:hypothetical protein
LSGTVIRIEIAMKDRSAANPLCPFQDQALVIDADPASCGEHNEKESAKEKRASGGERKRLTGSSRG